jgi:multiple sugar transport system substrate-binding protein
MPTLDMPEVAEAAEWFGKLVTTYGPEGAIGYNYDQATAALKAARANLTTNNQVFAVQMAEPGAPAARNCSFSMMPKGPKGRFPGVASHGWGIPTGSKNKDAAWAFITWATTKDIFRRMVVERGLGSVTRRSILESDAYKQKMTINGIDVAKLYIDTIAMASQGHMKYRTVHVYPQVNQQITKAMEAVASKQMSARDAFRQAQANAITDLRRSGVRL